MTFTIQTFATTTFDQVQIVISKLNMCNSVNKKISCSIERKNRGDHPSHRRNKKNNRKDIIKLIKVSKRGIAYRL